MIGDLNDRQADPKTELRMSAVYVWFMSWPTQLALGLMLYCLIAWCVLEYQNHNRADASNGQHSRASDK